MSLKDSILSLKSQGKSYAEIQKTLGCSKGTIAYHLGDGQKEKTRNRTRKHRKFHPFVMKIEAFKGSNTVRKGRIPTHKTNKLLYDKTMDFQKDGVKNIMSQTFTIEDVKNKIGDTPTCYLTGEPIDVNKPRTYHFDHIVPRSRGGSNTLDNLGVCTKKANMSKQDMTKDEYIEHCKRVLIHNGFEVNKAER
jgi:5-methylcytosine-specific restriction endonuclease McrA